MDTARQDIRAAGRLLRRSPGFAAVAVISVALGISVNTAMFTVVHAVLLQTIPFPDPGRLVRLVQQHTGGDGDVTVPEYQIVSEHGHVFSSIAAYLGGGEQRLDARGRTTWVTSLVVSTDFLRTLRVPVQLGREFQTDETRAGGPLAAVISDRLWRDAFDADPRAIGQAVALGNTMYTIEGVLPRGFWFPQPVDVLVPLQPAGTLADLGTNTQLIARLNDGIDLTRAQADVSALTDDLRRTQGGSASRNYRGLLVLSYHDWLVGDVRLNLVLLFAATGVLMAISCANVAILLLARTASRASEIGIRLALGGRRQLAGQFLCENLMVALFGALLGVVAAYQLVHVCLAWMPFALPVTTPIGLDRTALAFAIAVSLGTAVVFTFIPLWSARRLDLQTCLRSDGRNSGAHGISGRPRQILVVAEVALSTTLLIVAVLLIQSLSRLHEEPLGFSPDGLITFETPFAPERASNAVDRLNFTRALLARLEQTPGVRAAAATTVLPLAGQNNVPAQHDGHPEQSIGAVEVRAITPAYFEVMGIPQLRGGPVVAHEVDAPQPVAIVNNAIARRWWPDADPIGDRIVIGRYQGKELFADPPREVVAMVGDTKSASLQAPPRPTVYVPIGNAPSSRWIDTFTGSTLAWAVKTNGTVDIASALLSAVSAVDPGQRVRRLRTMNEIVASTSATSRFNATLFSVFAGTALLLATVGLYGVQSFLVATRRHEIGTRIALGASPSGVLATFLRQGLTLAAVGLAIGMAGALMMARWLSSLLFGVKPTDIASFSIVSAVLFTAMALASYFPARRAAALDPMIAMRSE